MTQEELMAHVADPLWKEEILQAFRRFADILLQDESLNDDERLIVIKQKREEIIKKAEQERNYYKKHEAEK